MAQAKDDHLPTWLNPATDSNSEYLDGDQGQISSQVSVAVVDDDADTRLFFKDLISSADGFTFAGDFANGASALNGIPRLKPDLVLMDIRMSGLNGIECLKRLKKVLVGLRVIMVTALFQMDWVDSALRAGADGYLIKPVTAEQCVTTLRFVGTGQIPAGQAPLPETIRLPRATTGVCASLSPRENQVMRCFWLGLLYKEVGDKLGISYSSVHRYQERIFRKLHVGNRSEAIRVWRMQVG